MLLELMSRQFYKRIIIEYGAPDTKEARIALTANTRRKLGLYFRMQTGVFWHRWSELNLCIYDSGFWSKIRKRTRLYSCIREFFCKEDI